MGQTKTQKAAAGSKKVAKPVEPVVTVKTLLMKTKTVQPRLTMTDVFNDDLLLEELHDLRASKRPISVVPLTFLEPTSRLGFFSSDTEIQPKTVISKKVTTGSLLLQNMANVSAAVLQGEKSFHQFMPVNIPGKNAKKKIYESYVLPETTEVEGSDAVFLNVSGWVSGYLVCYHQMIRDGVEGDDVNCKIVVSPADEENKWKFQVVTTKLVPPYTRLLAG